MYFCRIRVRGKLIRGTAELTVPLGIGSGNDSKDFFKIKITEA
jgi:hypothetical protein